MQLRTIDIYHGHMKMPRFWTANEARFTDAQRASTVLDGVVSAFDLFGVSAPRPRSGSDPASADAAAIGGDWRRVGDSLHVAMGRAHAKLPDGKR